MCVIEWRLATPCLSSVAEIAKLLPQLLSLRSAEHEVAAKELQDDLAALECELTDASHKMPTEVRLPVSNANLSPARAIEVRSARICSVPWRVPLLAYGPSPNFEA